MVGWLVLNKSAISDSVRPDLIISCMIFVNMDLLYGFVFLCQ
jgi:hypothetical protein